ncbi:MAG: hypothetical protein HY810_00720 [Candidatus Omnitrophica bacterium]|nr:hypothetical protein [Candidatus Omnitrophota bacterium]
MKKNTRNADDGKQALKRMRIEQIQAKNAAGIIRLNKKSRLKYWLLLSIRAGNFMM